MASSQSTLQSQRMLVLSGYLALVFGFTLVVALPYVRTTAAARAEIAQAQREVADRQDKKKELGELQTRVLWINKQTRNFSRLVPANQDLGPFLHELSSELDAAGMRDISVSAMPPTPLGKSQRLPIEVHSRGTYTQFHNFLVKLENMDRLSSVGKLTIDADGEMNGNVVAQLLLYIYNTKPGS